MIVNQRAQLIPASSAAPASPRTIPQMSMVQPHAVGKAKRSGASRTASAANQCDHRRYDGGNSRHEDHAGDDKRPQRGDADGLGGKSRDGQQEPRDADPYRAEAPQKMTGERAQQHGGHDRVAHQLDTGVVESESGLQQRSEDGVHGDEAEQHRAAGRDGKRKLAADRQCEQIAVLPAQACWRPAARRLDKNRRNGDRGERERRRGEGEHPPPAESQRHRLCIDLPDDAGHQESSRHGADPNGPPAWGQCLGHVCRRHRGETGREQALDGSQQPNDRQS